ncbi:MULTISPECIES: hypothetical protein [Methylobacterium]|uniref:hypothetical protein n=1 Tax=Methylobacterium TaxID=407 RepID=UPI00104919EA|nr:MULTISPECIES: hypothetical protein [Methylobacterium]MDR7039892.1 acetylornithine/succinyldiaminopimelate/putrescine aminotransferase [Methylobacterium sp. BE186]
MPHASTHDGAESASAAARAAARCLEAREAIRQIGDPTLQAVFDLLLFQIGRELAKELESDTRPLE